MLILPPQIVESLVERLTEAETDQLDQYVGFVGDNPDEADCIRCVERTCEWLLARFPEVAGSVRRSQNSLTN